MHPGLCHGYLEDTMSYFKNVNISQNVEVDANNSHTSNVNAGVTWSGSATSTLGVSGIQVMLKTDQNCTVYVDQAGDSTPNWDIVDTYYYYASIGNFGITIQAVGAYVRVRVKNTGSSNTTYFRLSTVLCPVIEAVPRSLDENGHLATAVHSIKDGYGYSVENTPMGEMRTIEPVRLVGSTFEGTTIDPAFWTTAASGTSAAITQANTELTLTSGTAAAATVTAFSVRRGRAVGGVSMRYRAVIQLGDTGTAHNKRRWGIGWGSTEMPAVTDGAYFQIDGTTFGIRIKKTNSETVAYAIDSGSFNGVLGATWTPTTDATTYEIYWTSTRIWFVVGDDILHTITASSASWADTRSFHVFMDSLNDGTGLAASVTMKVRVATIYRMGKIETNAQYLHISGNAATWNVKYSAGALHKFIFNNTTGTSVTLYDAAAGTTNAIGIITTASASLGSWDYGKMPFYNGLTIVTVGNGLDATVVFE